MLKFENHWFRGRHIKTVMGDKDSNFFCLIQL